MPAPTGNRNATKPEPLVWLSIRITPTQLIWLRKMPRTAQCLRDMLDFVRAHWEQFEAWRKCSE